MNAIAWDGFDVDKVEVRAYTTRCERDDKCTTYPAYPDPLSYALRFGFFVPFCWLVVLQPSTPGLYHARIASDHRTGVRNHSGDIDKIPTAEIDLIALARSPADLIESLRRAKAKYAAPAAAAMERGLR